MDIQFHTTFPQDFTIADAFGEKAVRDTYERSKHYISDVSYWKELVVVLNHKIWQHFNNGNDPLARVYDELWREAHAKALDTFKGDDFKEYFDFTD